MGTDVTALVIEHDPTDDVRRLGDWLTEAGLILTVCRPHAGDAIPDNLDGYGALIVLGVEGNADAPWSADLESLLRKAVRHHVATLAIGAGAQFLAAAHGGTVERSAAGPEFGAKLVARRDVAEQDPTWQFVPFVPDVLQWHRDEITELPHGAVLLAASTKYPVQAFRIGERAWGMQFHIECDVDMVASWLRTSDLPDDEAGAVLDEFAVALDDLEDVWQPFAQRFAAVARGELATSPLRTLPLLGH